MAEPHPSPSTLPPAERYAKLAAAGQLSDDPAQRLVIGHLQQLHDSLVKTGGIFNKWFKKSPPAPQSLYIWGNVGRGKSMLMDLFFASAPVKKKRRVHFHAFMQEVHARIHALRKQAVDDPVATLAIQIAHDTSLMCFDELQANDVTDATLLFRLFSGLFEAGVVIVSTSNHPPASLYTGGVQRERFDKFVALLSQRMQIVSLSSPADYRHLKLKALHKTYHAPLGHAANEFIARACEELSQGAPTTLSLTVHGRLVNVKQIAEGVVLSSFSELCESALGAADYLALCRAMDTLILTGIPKLTPEKRNEARRFVTLIDSLYEHKITLLCTAEALPNALYPEGDGSFEFQRTVSRLMEMQSADYLKI